MMMCITILIWIHIMIHQMIVTTPARMNTLIMMMMSIVIMMTMIITIVRESEDFVDHMQDLAFMILVM
jgi:hypothetical protein